MIKVYFKICYHWSGADVLTDKRDFVNRAEFIEWLIINMQGRNQYMLMSIHSISPFIEDSKTYGVYEHGGYLDNLRTVYLRYL